MSKNKQTFLKVGKIKEAHGLKGEVFVLVFSKDTTWSDELKKVCLRSSDDESQKEEKFFQVERVKAHKQGLIIKFKTVDDRNKSENLIGWTFLIPEESLTSQSGETIYLKEVLNFEVFLKDQFVGYVKSFGSNGIQDLLVISQDDHVFEVPFVSDFILNIDFQAQKIFMDFPEGLMNLSEVE